MCSRYLSALLLASVAIGRAEDSTVLRVCADPNNLPFSNQAGQGLENKMARIIASDMGEQLAFTWWAERKSFLRNSLQAGKCDVIMGVPSALDGVSVTKAYYRSSYVFVTRSDRKLNLRSLFDPRLENCRIGIHVTGDDYAPPAQLLARQGLSANLVGFSLFGADGEANPPSKLIDAVRNRTVDVAIVWGPFAGYFARHGGVPLDIRAVSPASFLGIPFTYDISVAVRKPDVALRDRIDRALDHRRSEVNSLLQEYGICDFTR